MKISLSLERRGREGGREEMGGIPRLVASSNSAVSTALPGRCT